VVTQFSSSHRPNSVVASGGIFSSRPGDSLSSGLMGLLVAVVARWAGYARSRRGAIPRRPTVRHTLGRLLRSGTRIALGNACPGPHHDARERFAGRQRGRPMEGRTESGDPSEPMGDESCAPRGSRSRGRRGGLLRNKE
jgi:hypothetical protein